MKKLIKILLLMGFGYSQSLPQPAVVGEDFPRSWGLIFDPAISGEFDGQIQLHNDPRETV